MGTVSKITTRLLNLPTIRWSAIVDKERRSDPGSEGIPYAPSLHTQLDSTYWGVERGGARTGLAADHFPRHFAGGLPLVRLADGGSAVLKAAYRYQ